MPRSSHHLTDHQNTLAGDVGQNVAQNEGFGTSPFPEGHVIACVQTAGDVYAQGLTLGPMDRRGFIKTDMHGRLAIDIGGRIVVGRPIPSVRRRDA